MNITKTETDSDTENKQVVTSGKRGGGGARWGRGLRDTTSRCKIGM